MERYEVVPEDNIRSSRLMGFIPRHASYVKTQDINIDKILDVFGPYAEVPKFLIAPNESEVKPFKKELVNQWHILVYDNAIFLNKVSEGYFGAALIRTEATFFLKGALLSYSGRALSSGIEHMIEIPRGPKKIIYSSDFCLKIIIETLDRLGYSQMQE